MPAPRLCYPKSLQTHELEGSSMQELATLGARRQHTAHRSLLPNRGPLLFVCLCVLCVRYFIPSIESSVVVCSFVCLLVCLFACLLFCLCDCLRVCVFVCLSVGSIAVCCFCIARFVVDMKDCMHVCLSSDICCQCDALWILEFHMFCTCGIKIKGPTAQDHERE